MAAPIRVPRSLLHPRRMPSGELRWTATPRDRMIALALFRAWKINNPAAYAALLDDLGDGR